VPRRVDQFRSGRLRDQLSEEGSGQNDPVQELREVDPADCLSHFDFQYSKANRELTVSVP